MARGLDSELASPEGDGFWVKLGSNPLAWRPTARSGPEISGPETEGPEVHNLRCSNVPVEDATAFAAVLALGQRLCSDDPALGARLRSAAWIDLHKDDPGTCSLVVEHCGQLRPRGVVNMFRQHAAGKALDVEICDPNAPETRHELAGHLAQMIAPLGRHAPLELGERGFALGSRLRGALASGIGRNALLEAGVVELAEVREHVAEGGGLRPVRLDAVLVAQHGHVSLALFDVPAHGRLGDGTDRGGEVVPAPQCRQPRAQGGELLSEEPRCSAFEAVVRISAT